MWNIYIPLIEKSENCIPVTINRRLTKKVIVVGKTKGTGSRTSGFRSTAIENEMLFLEWLI
jgi:hypothetical protein